MVPAQVSFLDVQTAAFSCAPVSSCPSMLDVFLSVLIFSFCFFFFVCLFCFVLFCFISWPRCFLLLGLSFRPAIDLGSLAVKALSPNPWLARDRPLSFYIDNHQIGLGLTLVTSFELHHLVKDIISKYGNIPKCWGLGLRQIVFKHVLIYLTAPGVSCGTWGLRSSGQHVGSSSLTRDRSPGPCPGSAGS